MKGSCGTAENFQYFFLRMKSAGRIFTIYNSCNGTHSWNLEAVQAS